MTYSEAKAEIRKRGPLTFKWINVYDVGQSQPLSDWIPQWIEASHGTGEGLFQQSITVSSVADMVRQVNQITDTKELGLRLFGMPCLGPFEEDRFCYVSVGRHSKADMSGEYSLQINFRGELVGGAAVHLARMKRVTRIVMMDESNYWSLQLCVKIGLALQNQFALVSAKGAYAKVDTFYKDPVFKDMLAKEKARKEKKIEEAHLENGSLKKHLGALSGQIVAGQRVVAKSHVVGAGETLSSISAKFYGTTAKWRNIYEANKEVIGANPNVLRAGMQLLIF